MHRVTPNFHRSKRKEKRARAVITKHSCALCENYHPVVRSIHDYALSKIRKYGNLWMDEVVQVERNLPYYHYQALYYEARRAKRPFVWHGPVPKREESEYVHNSHIVGYKKG